MDIVQKHRSHTTLVTVLRVPSLGFRSGSLAYGIRLSRFGRRPGDDAEADAGMTRGGSPAPSKVGMGVIRFNAYRFSSFRNSDRYPRSFSISRCRATASFGLVGNVGCLPLLIDHPFPHLLCALDIFLLIIIINLQAPCQNVSAWRGHVSYWHFLPYFRW